MLLLIEHSVKGKTKGAEILSVIARSTIEISVVVKMLIETDKI